MGGTVHRRWNPRRRTTYPHQPAEQALAELAHGRARRHRAHGRHVGGDSRVRADPLDLVIGPERVVPLSRAAAQQPAIRDRLAETRCAASVTSARPGVGVLRPGPTARRRGRFCTPSNACLRALARGAARRGRPGQAGRRNVRDARLLPVNSLVAPADLVTRIGLTRRPICCTCAAITDEFDVEAAMIAGRIAARESRTDVGRPGTSRAHEAVIRALCTATLRRAIASGRPDLAESDEKLGAYLLDTSASPSSRVGPLDVGLGLTLPLIALGAAGAAWLPQVASRLRTDVHRSRTRGRRQRGRRGVDPDRARIEVLLRPPVPAPWRGHRLCRPQPRGPRHVRLRVRGPRACARPSGAARPRAAAACSRRAPPLHRRRRAHLDARP